MGKSRTYYSRRTVYHTNTYYSSTCIQIFRYHYAGGGQNWLRITADNFETVFNTDEARMILLRYHNSDIIYGHEGLTYNGYRYISNNKRDWKPTTFEVKDFSYQLAEDHSYVKVITKWRQQ